MEGTIRERTARVLDAPFYLTLVARIMIFAIAALSLDLILGYGGMVSFGHAAYLGVGVYTVGILSAHGVASGFPGPVNARTELVRISPEPGPNAIWLSLTPYLLASALTSTGSRC